MTARPIDLTETMSRPASAASRGGERGDPAQAHLVLPTESTSTRPPTHHYLTTATTQTTSSTATNTNTNTATLNNAPADPDNDLTPSDRYRLNRDRRLAMRDVLARLTNKDRCKTCGALPIGEGGTVTLLRAEVSGIGTVAGVKGAGRCNMANLCPWCGAHAREKRAIEVERYASRHLRSGGAVWFGAFTVARAPGEAVEDSTKVVQTAWSTMWSGRWAQDFKADHGVLGVARAFEWTISLDGSGHPHIHPLIFLERRLERDEEARFVGGLLLRWREVLAAAGRNVSLVHGVDLTPVVLDDEGRTVGLGEYFTKAGAWGIGHELARVDIKRARTGASLSPWEILAYFAETGDLAARGAWQAYERAAAGKAAVYWPRGLRAKLDDYAGEPAPDLVLDLDNEPVVIELDNGTDEDDTDDPVTRLDGARAVATLGYEAWRWIHGMKLLGVVLRLVELADTDDDVLPLLDTLAVQLRAPGAVRAAIGAPEPA